VEPVIMIAGHIGVRPGLGKVSTAGRTPLAQSQPCIFNPEP